MGDDTPMAVLSTKIRSPFDYFRQQFAQVTNPPIDPLRERIVMSLQTNVGRESNLFDIGPDHAEQVLINSPVLSQEKLRQLLGPTMFEDSHAFIDLNVADSMTLIEALDQICSESEQSVRDGKFLLILSDRYLKKGKLPVHALLATGAVHHHLVKTGQRCDANIVVETGVARDPHHFACLIGYGATMVYPLPRLPVTARYCPPRQHREAAAARPQLQTWRPQGLVQGDVEDGHIVHFELPRCAAVRDRRS